MGWRTRLRQWWVRKNANSKNIAWWKLCKIRSKVQCEHGGDPNVVRPLEAKELERTIHEMAAQGDPDYDHVCALDMWRLARQEYPEFITEADQPDTSFVLRPGECAVTCNNRAHQHSRQTHCKLQAKEGLTHPGKQYVEKPQPKRPLKDNNGTYLAIPPI